MKAVLIAEAGAAPEVGDIELEAGGGDVIVELEAASLNPADVAIASGSFYAGHPPMPYVPGLEAVGRADGRRVFAMGSGLGVARNGTASEQFAAPGDVLIDIPDDIEAGLAAALGTAALAGWLPIMWRAKVEPGETVIVLGATGTAGTIAVQAARAAGAGPIVAAGRNPQRLEALAFLADEVVSLEGDDVTERLQAAAPDGADVIYDALWGEPLVAALTAAKLDGRVVHLGQSAGAMAELPSALVRGKRLTISGYSNFGVPRDDQVAAYQTMVERAMAGDLVLEVHPVPLDDVATAWSGVASSAGKFVLVP